jgi:MFS family permease
MILGLAGLGISAFFGTFPGVRSEKLSVPWLTPAFYISMSLSVIGFAFVNPSVSALVSKRSDPARQGEVMGVNQSFASLGRILGPFLGSVLFQANDSRTLPYAAAVLTLAIVLMLLPRVKAAA